MTYDFTLKTIGLLLGLLLLAGHAVAFLMPGPVRDWLVRLPRSRSLGVTFLAIDLVWTFWLAFTMDWGEFYYLRQPMLVLLPVFAFLVIQFVDEFLAVRALGILGLLGAAPLLDSAFLQPQTSRLLVVIVAYLWAIVGMFWIASPHLLRDQVQWVSRSTARWQAASLAGIVYGLALLFCAVLWY